MYTKQFISYFKKFVYNPKVAIKIVCACQLLSKMNRIILQLAGGRGPKLGSLCQNCIFIIPIQLCLSACHIKIQNTYLPTTRQVSRTQVRYIYRFNSRFFCKDRGHVHENNLCYNQFCINYRIKQIFSTYTTLFQSCKLSEHKCHSFEKYILLGASSKIYVLYYYSTFPFL